MYGCLAEAQELQSVVSLPRVIMSQQATQIKKWLTHWTHSLLKEISKENLWEKGKGGDRKEPPGD